MKNEKQKPDTTAENIMDPVAVQKNAPKPHTMHPGAQWFPKAGLGLFLHWGISTLDTDDSELSWCLMKNRLSTDDPVVPPEKYYGELAPRFQPDRYDPDQWLSAAAEAGFRYAVLITRHLDGFALWPSKYGDLNTKNYMNSRDLVAPFVEACRKNNLKVGLYYSPEDWYFFREYNTWDHNFSWDPFDSWLRKDVPQSLLDAHKKYCNNQLRELLTNYGKIDLLWFDGVMGGVKAETLREIQPWLVINSRLGDGQPGDFQTPERSLPEEQLRGWWEYCDIWNRGPWSWTPHFGEQYRPLSEILDMFVKVREKGGNMLINCAPRPNGELPDECYKRFSELASWMKAGGSKYMPAWDEE